MAATRFDWLTLGDDRRWGLALTDLGVGDTGNAHDREQGGCNQSDLFHERLPFVIKRIDDKKNG